MLKNTSCNPSTPRFELNALAPLRVGGLAQAIINNKDNPEEVERLARELLDLEPHLLAMLIAEAEKTPALA